jgi:uncharacterized protein YjbJ (UPF0337 family)
MSDSWSRKVHGITSRVRDAVAGADGEVDVDTLIARARETVANASGDVDREALLARLKAAAGKAGDAVDVDKLKQALDEVDREKVKGWVDEAKTLSAGAAATLEERAPGAVDKLLGVGKAVLGDLTGNESLSREGELEQFRGEIKERFANAPDAEDPDAR